MVSVLVPNPIDRLVELLEISISEVTEARLYKYGDAVICELYLAVFATGAAAIGISI